MIRLGFCLAAVVLFATSLQAAAENSASGALTVNGSSTEIKHAYVDEGPEDLIVVVTDRPMAKDDIPFGLNNLASEDKVRGIVVTISKGTKGLSPGLNALYHPVWQGQLGTIGNGVLTLSKFDKDEISGKISTPEENTFGEYKYFYAISFNLKLGEPKKKEPLSVEIEGTEDAPSKAYAAYYRALMAGDKNGLRKHLPSEVNKQADDETIDTVIELAQTLKPTNLKIIGTEIKGKEALLKAEGLRDGEKSTGSISMKLEDGEWKVFEDDWKVNVE